MNAFTTRSKAEQRFDEILRRFDLLDNQGAHLMAKVDDLNAELVKANEVTNEIATDVADLLTRAIEGGLTPAEADAVKADIAALTDRLRGVAAQHTPAPPATPV